MERLFTRTRLILLAVLAIIILVLVWCFTHSFVEITVNNSVNGDLNYRLLDQSNLRTAETTSSSKTIKKLVRRGSHEVLVRQGETSYFAVVKSNGFLSTSRVSAELSVEKARSFIGNNPGSCMYIVAGVLLSQACGDSVDRLQTHVPATASLPTFTKKAATPFSGFVEGVANTSEGSIILIKSPDVDEDEGAPHTAYLLNAIGATTNGVALADLEENKVYNLVNYKDGFIVYAPDSSRAYYYTSRAAAPSIISLNQPKTTGLKLNSLNTKDETIVMAYSNDTRRELSNTSDPEGEEIHSETVDAPSKIKSEVVLQNDGQAKHFVFETEPARIRYCAENKICTLDEGVLGIYDVSSDKQKLEFRVTGVTSIENSPSGLLVVREEGVMRLDLDKHQGMIEYTLGDYRYCGIRPEGTTYIVCVANNDNLRSAILVNPNQNDTDNIDKKIQELAKLGEIKELSIYGNFIYVSPELGDLKYIEASGGFGYDPALISSANTKINQEIERLGIDRNKYTVVNSFN